MTQTQLNTDAHEIVSYLLGTKSRVTRTKQAIRDACHLTDARRAEEAFRQLIALGYLSDVGDSTYELSQTGIKYARSIDAKGKTQVTNIIENVTGGAVTVNGVQDITATPINTPAVFSKPDVRGMEHGEEREIERTRVSDQHELPTIYLHPMRMTQLLINDQHKDASKAGIGRGIGMRYLLAFETFKDVLPVPVLDDDILGRSKHTNIWMKHDDFISLKHCRFKLKREKNSKYYSLYVEDLNSSNGTYVDNIIIEPNKPTLLRHGARLQVGNTTLIVIQIPY